MEEENSKEEASQGAWQFSRAKCQKDQVSTCLPPAWEAGLDTCRWVFLSSGSVCFPCSLTVLLSPFCCTKKLINLQISRCQHSASLFV